MLSSGHLISICLQTNHNKWHKNKRFCNDSIIQAVGNREANRMTLEQQQSKDLPYSKKQVLISLSSLFLIYLTYSYYIQTPGTAAPRMAADLDGMRFYSWAVSIPGLGLAFGTLLVGKLSDIYGRRFMMLGALGIFLIGAILSAISPTFVLLIAARTLLCLGQGGLAPLIFSVVGDMFPPMERSKWVGLLNIPTGILALCGPTIGGWLVDHMSWRHIFWFGVPLLLLCIITTLGMPALIQGAARKIDIRGSALVALASSTLIFGLSFAGTTYPWASVQVVGLLFFSIIFWALFLWAESTAREPILDLRVLRNRPFATAATAGFLSFFGMMGMMVYYPLLMQGIQGVSATRSGLVLTPFGVLMAFIGVPVGFLLARMKHYKWMYTAGYGLLTVVMICMIFFDSNTPLLWGVVLATIGGLGLGAIPTINTMVIQTAIPKKLLGIAMGASFFSISMGVAIAPAILGSAMNIQYNRELKSSLPAALTQYADEATMTSLGNPRVLLSEPAMIALRETLGKRGEDGQALLKDTIQAIRGSMEAGLRAVFIIGAITMLLSFLLIATIPEIAIYGASENAGDTVLES
jgi:MFS family permease